MKVLIAAILIAFVVYVSGDQCIATTDCYSYGMITCGGAHKVVCVQHQFSGGHCKCTDGGAGGYACTMKADCPDCSHFQEKHCIDGLCHCTV